MVTSAPIFISSRSGPSGITAVAKNKAKTSPIEAVHPTTTSSRQPTRCGRCSPAAIATPAAATMPIGRAERGNRDRPHAGLEAVERDAGIDQPEQQEHAFHGKAPPALEERQRIVSLRRRLDKQASIVSPVGKKRNDRHQRERGMNAAQEQGAPGQRARTEQVQPEVLDAAAPQGGGRTDGDGHETETNGRVRIANGLKHRHTGQADRVGGNRQQEQKWNGWMTPEDQPGNDVAPRNINGTGRHPPALEHVLADIVDKREIARDRHDHAADGGGDGQRGTAPRVKGPTRHRGLRHFLGDQRKEEDDADIVHGEGGGVRESIVAVRERVGPDQRGDAADRQGEQIVEDETGDTKGDPLVCGSSSDLALNGPGIDRRAGAGDGLE